MSLTTEFAHPRSVEVWDAWYRWREDAVLRDVTVDDTWWRVAKSVAGAEAQQGLLWAHRFVSAFSRWRMLPDERLLRHAGTSTSLESLEAPVAVLNAAAFVRVPMQTYAYFDRDLFLDMAALAVRFLDDAMETFDPAARTSGLRVGIIGLVDALHLLRMPAWIGRPGRGTRRDRAWRAVEHAAGDLAQARGSGGADRAGREIRTAL